LQISRPNIVIHMGASTWNAKVRAEDGKFVGDRIVVFSRMLYSGLVVIRSRSTSRAQIDEQDQPDLKDCRRLISECRAKTEARGPEAREPVCDLIKYYEQAVDLLMAAVQKNR
jgi:hypothetical protein